MGGFSPPGEAVQEIPHSGSFLQVFFFSGMSTHEDLKV